MNNSLFHGFDFSEYNWKRCRVCRGELPDHEAGCSFQWFYRSPDYSVAENAELVTTLEVDYAKKS